ncbi:PLC-like phosphodiesterase [Chytriomyces sp. MP71]|nr:PLC-like phosphodiesterase [Chytriomyces sp. MP71]
MLTAFLGLFGLHPPSQPQRNRLAAFGASIHCFAHRGGSLEHVENTLEAFVHAASLPLKLTLEMDVGMTQDGHLVVFHDHTLARMCGHQWEGRRIEDLDLAQLPPLQVPAALHGREGLDTRIPLLEDVFKACPSVPMSIDVKHGSEEMIIKIGTLIQRYNRERITLWGGFDASQVNLCIQHFGTSIPLLFSRKRVIQSFIMWFFGLSRWMSYPESALVIPNRWYLMWRGWFEEMNRLGISVVLW